MARLIHIVSLVLFLSLCSISSAGKHPKRGKKRQMPPLGPPGPAPNINQLYKEAVAVAQPEKAAKVDVGDVNVAPLNNLAKAVDAVHGTEGKAGEAIKALLQEKINQKFKEAANEVKGVLVKQLGDSLKSAHDSFKIGAAGSKIHHKKKENKGAALIHQNKGNRTRKESGPPLGAPKPVQEETNTEASDAYLGVNVPPPKPEVANTSPPQPPCETCETCDPCAPTSPQQQPQQAPPYNGDGPFNRFGG